MINIMKYERYLNQRTNTFKKAWDCIKDKNDIVIVELGTSRSFKSWGISNDINHWYPYNPEKWAWSDGCFTKLFTDNLIQENIKFTLYSIDPCPNAMKVVKTMIGDNPRVKCLQMTSTEFLQNFNEKIDLLYMDHLESGETACQVHLEDSKIIIENDLMNDDSIILIDDCPEGQTGKGKYSIPYLKENGYQTMIHEYQMILKK
jgi:hypothetical protein